MFQEYITNIYILPLIATIVGLSLVYLYDKFEKKQYTSAQYLRIGILIYISTYLTLYISKLNCFTDMNSSTMSGGNIDPQSVMPQPNEFNKSHLEQFKIGVPTF